MEIWKSLTPFLIHSTSGTYFFKCPGCEYLHPFNVNPSKPQCWNFNGDAEKPTFSPSLLVNGTHPESRCHLFLIEGKIRFLSDCHHHLAGQTVDMIPTDEEDLCE